MQVISFVVPGGGLEPPQPCGLRILSPLRLPISPSGLSAHGSSGRGSDRAGFGSCCAAPFDQACAQGSRGNAMAVQAKCAQVVEIALAAALGYWQDVISVPQALAPEIPETPDSEQILPALGARAPQEGVGGERIYGAAGADALIAFTDGVAQVGRAGAQPPLVHAIYRAEGTAAFRDLKRAPAAAWASSKASGQKRSDGAAARHGACGAHKRSSGTMRIGYLGRSVILGCTSMRWPGTRCNRHFCAMVAVSRVASIQAKDSPMHWRPPPPKGK
jgi:hypothetical protein